MAVVCVYKLYINVNIAGKFSIVPVLTCLFLFSFSYPLLLLQARFNREKEAASKELAQLRANKPQTPVDRNGMYKSFTAY